MCARDGRFSSFVRTGAEGYILGHIPSKVVIKPNVKIVASPESQSKLNEGGWVLQKVVIVGSFAITLAWYVACH